MKKTIAILLSMVMVLGLAACGSAANPTRQSSAEGSMEENSVNDDVKFVEDGANDNADFEDNSADRGINDEMSEEDNSTEDMKNTEISEIQPEETESSDADGTKVLIAYFSATNTTEGVAEQIANGLGADLYEIVPEESYTNADLNYNDNNSRTTIEMNNPNARPAISGSVENMEQYDVVFIGYAGGIIGLN